MGIQSFVYWATQKFYLNAIFGRNQTYIWHFFFQTMLKVNKIYLLQYAVTKLRNKNDNPVTYIFIFPILYLSSSLSLPLLLFLYRFIVSFSINRSILFMRKQLTSAKLWAECLFQCVRMRTNVRIFCAGSRHYSMNSILLVSELCVYTHLNELTKYSYSHCPTKCSVYKSYKWDINCSSFQSRFKTIWMCQRCMRAVNVLLLHVICCYSISLSSVSSFTFIVFYSHFYIFRKPPTFLYPFRSLLLIHGVCFWLFYF